MQRHTKTYRNSVRKNTDWLSSQKPIHFFIIFMAMVILLDISPLVFSKTPTYVPSPPAGTTFGYVGITYEYVIVTMNPDSSWMFDWGDGSNSSWLHLEEGHTSITQTHQWTLPGTYQVHVKFKSDTVPNGIWSDAMFIEINPITNQDFPKKPLLYTGKIQGVCGQVYTYSALTTDPHDFPVCYRFDYGNSTLSEWTTFVPSGSSGYLKVQWEKPGLYILRTQALNQYGLESEWSDPVQVIMKNTSKNDTESIDFVVINNVHYQILFTSNYSGTFYDPSCGVSSDILWNGNGIFLIDDDSDGRWEYFYIPTQGLVEPYVEPLHPQKDVLSEIPWLLLIIILSTVLGIIGGITVLIKKGYIYFYEEEVVEED